MVNPMTSEYIHQILIKVFNDDNYSVEESTERKYSKDRPAFFVRINPPHNKNSFKFLKIYNNIIGTIISDDIWDVIFDYNSTSNITIRIPNDNTEEFFYIIKNKIKEHQVIAKLQNQLLNDLVKLKNDPKQLIRDFKISSIL